MKLLRWMVSTFPLNAVRVSALRSCGFKVGEEVYIGPGLILSTMNSDDSCMLTLGDRVSIGPGVTLVLASDANHSRLSKIFPEVRGSITLKDDVWLGAGVIILPNVTIGKCSAAAAGAVVTENVDEFSLVGGVPAKVIRNLKLS